MSPQEAALNAMYKRGKVKAATAKADQYKMVIYGFVGIVVVSILYTILFPKQKLGELSIIDDAQILVHNGQGHQFKHGRNELFESKTFGDVRSMFFSGLSDTNNVNSCKSAKAQSEDQIADEE